MAACWPSSRASFKVELYLRESEMELMSLISSQPSCPPCVWNNGTTIPCAEVWCKNATFACGDGVLEEVRP